MRLPCEKVKKKGRGTCITSTFREQKEKVKRIICSISMEVSYLANYIILL
jgi:hypothetical protein